MRKPFSLDGDSPLVLTREADGYVLVLGNAELAVARKLTDEEMRRLIEWAQAGRQTH